MTQDSDIKEVSATMAGFVAVNAAKEAAIAQEQSRQADTASLLAKVDEKLKEHHKENKAEMRSMLNDVLGKVFGKEANTYVVPNRVPLLCQDVSYMKESITEVKKAVAEINKLMKELPEEIDGKYASKLTQNIVYTAAGLIGLAFFGGLISLVIK